MANVTKTVKTKTSREGSSADSCGCAVPDVEAALDELGRRFPNLNWDFRPDPSAGRNEKISQWLGRPDEELMLCAFKGRKIHEPFHRQDFFFINFAYRGGYTALSAKFDSELTMPEGDCYIGQPYSGYALRADSREPVIILGILFRRGVFIRDFLPILSSDSEMLRFFLEPNKDRYSDEFIHLTIPKDSPVWKLLDIMAVEYVKEEQGSAALLKSLTLALTMYIAREYRLERERKLGEGNADERSVEGRMIGYIALHSDTITLRDLAEHFGYHPNYVSALLRERTGRTFSTILLEERMKKAMILVQRSSLSIEKIASIVGYSDTSNFYKAFNRVYHMTPREAAKKIK